MCSKFWLGNLKIKASWKDTGIEAGMKLKFIQYFRMWGMVWIDMDKGCFLVVVGTSG